MYTCKLFAQRIMPVFVVVTMVLSITFLTPVEEASAQEYIPTPVIYTIINTHTVLGLDFQPLEIVTLKIDDPDTEEYPDFQASAQNPDEDLYDHSSYPVTFSLANIFPLKPGYVIEMSDGVSVQTLILWDLSITDVDFTNDIVSGFTSRHGDFESVNVQAYLPNLVDRYSHPDENGYWTADFGDPNADPGGTTADLENDTYFFALQTDEYQNAVIFEWMALENTIPIQIDIRPGPKQSSINLGAKGVVPVAVLTTDEFDAGDLDPVTVVFAGASPLRWSWQDVDWDGDMDILFHFKTQELQLDVYSTEAWLNGATFDGISVEGADSVRIVPPG